ncbi:MAG: hypothetical protein IJC99_00405 [Clostridia bacterium]|nr:hypothetical protein [Clostridia bacterium]
MFRKIIADPSPPSENRPREGDLYRIVTTFGKTFELRYGYYDDIDRDGEPDVIYPDFTTAPIYTKKGEPFVTMMQDVCEHFKGKSKHKDDTTCSECTYFHRGEEWFGICTCPKSRENT